MGTCASARGLAFYFFKLDGQRRCRQTLAGPLVPPSSVRSFSIAAAVMSSEMPVPLLLLDTLEELSNEDFKRFQWTLSQPVLDGLPPMKRCHLEKDQRHDTAGRLMETYGEEAAVKVTVEVLKRIKHNAAARKLEERHGGGGGGGGGSPPATGTSAGSQSIIVAPNIEGSNSGLCLNMNINTR